MWKKHIASTYISTSLCHHSSSVRFAHCRLVWIVVVVEVFVVRFDRTSIVHWTAIVMILKPNHYSRARFDRLYSISWETFPQPWAHVHNAYRAHSVAHTQFLYDDSHRLAHSFHSIPTIHFQWIERMKGEYRKYAMFITRWRHASPFPLIALYLYMKIKHFLCCSVYPCYTYMYVCAFVSSSQQLHSITARLCAALLCCYLWNETHTNSIVCVALVIEIALRYTRRGKVRLC